VVSVVWHGGRRNLGSELNQVAVGCFRSFQKDGHDEICSDLLRIVEEGTYRLQSPESTCQTSNKSIHNSRRTAWVCAIKGTFTVSDLEAAKRILPECCIKERICLAKCVLEHSLLTP
jgi:hypothetical protein